MSFQERSAWVVMIAMIAAAAGYYLWLAERGGLMGGSVLAIVLASITFIGIAIVGHIVSVVIGGGDDEEDERDRMIELYGERAGGFALGAAALLGLAMALKEGELLIANLLFFGLVASEIVKNIWRVVLYRSGF